MMSLENFPSDPQSRLDWRRSLTEQVVRSLSFDYLRGIKDECNADAYAEYKARGYDKRIPYGTSTGVRKSRRKNKQ